MHSLSDAEDFTEGYRALKLGPVVGEPTAGWIIFTSDVGLLDGVVDRAHALRAHHRHERQGHGDASAAGRRARRATDRRVRTRARDSQLDAAVAELLKRLGQAMTIARHPERSDRIRDVLVVASHSRSRCRCRRVAGRARRSAARRPTAVQHYFDLTRPLFSGDRAYDQVAFMDQYFRWPGNTGFNASIHRVEDILKAAGYVEESKAQKGAALTYRIEHRPMRQPAWEPVDASVTIVGESKPVLAVRDESQHAGDRVVLDARHRHRRASSSTSGRERAADYDKASGRRARSCWPTAASDACFAEAVQKRGALGALAYNMPAYTQPEMHRTSIQFGSVAVRQREEELGHADLARRASIACAPRWRRAR